jgi:hypothetical protein
MRLRRTGAKQEQLWHNPVPAQHADNMMCLRSVRDALLQPLLLHATTKRKLVDTSCAAAAAKKRTVPSAGP